MQPKMFLELSGEPIQKICDEFSYYHHWLIHEEAWSILTPAPIYANEHGLHNPDGPALVYQGEPQWWLFGLPHRTDGRAIGLRKKNNILVAGAYYLHGYALTDHEFREMPTSPVEIAHIMIRRSLGVPFKRQAILHHIECCLMFYGISKNVVTTLFSGDALRGP